MLSLWFVLVFMEKPLAFDYLVTKINNRARNCKRQQ